MWGFVIGDHIAGRVALPHRLSTIEPFVAALFALYSRFFPDEGCMLSGSFRSQCSPIRCPRRSPQVGAAAKNLLSAVSGSTWALSPAALGMNPDGSPHPTAGQKG